MAGRIKIIPKEFDWDKGNKEKNLIKHKVSYKESEEVFFNKPVKFYPDKKHSQKEQRFVAYGKTDKYKKLTVIFTLRDKKIRIISVRPMSRKERSRYEQKTKN